MDRRERPLIFLSSAAMQGMQFGPGETAVCTIPHAARAGPVHLGAVGDAP